MVSIQLFLLLLLAVQLVLVNDDLTHVLNGSAVSAAHTAAIRVVRVLIVTEEVERSLGLLLLLVPLPVPVRNLENVFECLWSPFL